MARPALSKLPLAKVVSDDFVITLGRKKFRPHAGEEVNLRTTGSISDWELQSRLNRFDDLRKVKAPDLTDDQHREITETIALIIEFLDRQIVNWTWTDEAGKALPEPSPESLRALTWEELTYLIVKAFRPAAKEARKNVSSPSA